MNLLDFFQSIGAVAPIPIKNCILTLVISLFYTLLFCYIRIYFLHDVDMDYTAKRTEFLSTMTILGPTISLIMILVGQDLANAFALLGIMSIIRFRNPSKGAGDIIYYLVAITIGMTCGEQYFLIAGVFCIFASIILLCINGFSKIPLEEKVNADKHAKNSTETNKETKHKKE